MIWEVKHTLIYVKDERGLPESRPSHLIVARNVEHPQEVKYFVSNAPPETSVSVPLLVAFSRWRIERCFEDPKGEIGLDHFEGRRWLGLQRHLALSAVSYLFLTRTHERLRGGNPELTVCQVHTAICAVVRSLWLDDQVAKELFAQAADEIRWA